MTEIPPKAKPGWLRIENSDYLILDRLGYRPTVGGYAIEVSTAEGPRMAFRGSAGCPWRWWTVEDRLKGG